MEKERRSVKTAAWFSLIVFIILVVTMCVCLFLLLLLYRLGIVTEEHSSAGILVFLLSAVIVGTALSRVIRNPALYAVGLISEATKEVAKGNYDVQLDEQSIHGEELRTMAHNFNRMTRQLSQTEIMRNDFIENVSHEFKTPISAIEGYAVLLQSPTLSEEKKAEYTERIIRSSRRLSSLAGNILLLSRLENQELAISKDWFSLDEQIREIVLMAENEWSRRNIELDIDLDQADYYGNQELLAQVWQNIFGNAMKFVPDGGSIRIQLFARDHSVCVYIADDGPGMDEETLKRIYEKFYQADASRSTSGNGLGLTLARRIVDLHDGKILVDSRPGEGTTFSVTLPNASF